MRDSRLRWSVSNTLMILCFTVLIVVIFYFLDLWFLEVFQENLSVPLFSSLTDLFFIQGVGLLLIGFMALLGRIKYLRHRGRPVSLGDILGSTNIHLGTKWLSSPRFNHHLFRSHHDPHLLPPPLTSKVMLS